MHSSTVCETTNGSLLSSARAAPASRVSSRLVRFLDREPVARLDDLEADIVEGRVRVDPQPTQSAAGLVEPVAAGALHVDFDGTTCRIDGDVAFELGERQQFVLRNTSTDPAGVTVWKVSEGTTVDDVERQGIFEFADLNADLRALGEVGPGGEVATTARFDEPGDWLVMCVGEQDHPAAIVTIT